MMGAFYEREYGENRIFTILTYVISSLTDTTHDAYGRSNATFPRRSSTVYWWHEKEQKWYLEHFADPRQLYPEANTTTDGLQYSASKVSHTYVLNKYGREPFKKVRLWEKVKFKDFDWPRGRFNELVE